jgi:hypothetical protein
MRSFARRGARARRAREVIVTLGLRAARRSRIVARNDRQARSRSAQTTVELPERFMTILLLRGARIGVASAFLGLLTISFQSAGPTFEAAETICGPSALAATRIYDPPWSAVPPLLTLQLQYNPAKTPQQNGATFKQAAQALLPGQALVLGAGTWFVDSFFTLNLQGTALAPIRIVGMPGSATVITRSDAGQNTLNVGSGGAARYLVLSQLEITGGDIGLRLYDAANVWVDRCHVHHCAGAGITANAVNTDHLYLTRNEVDHTNGTAEGFYLGGNNGSVVMRDSIVALNLVHDTGGSQGDGIEVKQGSFNNWIVANLVHDCQYPCILLYGTGGNAPNIVERNVCYRSGDNVMQVQGEAIVRNNLLMAGSNNGFESHDHQGLSRDLTFVHNTIVNTGRGASLASWANRPNMVFANNVVYSQSAASMQFGNGSAGVQLAGNVVRGSVSGASFGFVQGTGLADFVNVSWDGSRRNAHPQPGGVLIGSGNPAFAVPDDLTGAPRALPLDSGCYDGR